jgi:hypothetical protein
MRTRPSLIPVGLAISVLLLLGSPGKLGVVRPASANAAQAEVPGPTPFEVWIADQSDTRKGYGGQLLIYDGASLAGPAAARAQPVARIDLGAETSDLCVERTGRRPTRPHMILFNQEHSHAILSFVASGHVVIFDAAARRPLSCIETTERVTGQGTFRQAHAAFAAPDGSFIVVANQNGKRLERIDSDFTANTFVHNREASLDLMTCTTPGGRPCEDAALRPINWPICPVIDSSSRYAFVTLRGGGLFVVDAKATPMAIVAEYDKATVKGNGCGGAEVGGYMYLNSGGSPVNVSGTDPHHQALYGFDVYRFPLTGYAAGQGAGSPAPKVLFSKEAAADSHGVAAAGNGRYLWVMDRHNDVAEILDLSSEQRVHTVPLNGPLTDNAAPDLIDAAPGGDRLFVALRGPVPLSGDPHNAVGSTPGLGIIEITENGRSGALVAIVPMVNGQQQEGQAPDPHGLRVRRLR